MMDLGLDVAGVSAKDLDKLVKHVDAPTVERFLGLLGLTSVDATSTVDKVKLLANFLQAKVPKDRLVKCDKCGCRSDARFSVCPVCADGEVDPAVAAQVSSDDEGKAIEELKVKHAPLVKTSPRRRRTVASAEAPTAQGEVVGDKVEQADESSANGGSDPVTEIVEATPKATTATPEELDELDASVARIHALATNAGGPLYDLGHELLVCFDKKLWEKRHASWREFVEKELPISLGYSYQLMDISSKYPRSQVQEIGIAKLLLLLRVPDDQRGPLIEEAKAGASRAALKERVHELVSEGNGASRQTGRTGFKGTAPQDQKPKAPPVEKRSAKTPPKDKARKAPEKEAKLTVSMAPGKGKIALYAKTDSRKRGEPQRAKRIGEEPWGEETLPNGIIIRYQVRLTSKGLEIVIDRRAPS